MRRPADELLQKKVGKIATRSSAESLSRMRLAVCGFADELHAGLTEELKKKTRMEIFRALRFVARTPAKGTKKIVHKISKKLAAKMLAKKKRRLDVSFEEFSWREYEPPAHSPPWGGGGGGYSGGVFLFCAGPLVGGPPGGFLKPPK